MCNHELVIVGQLVSHCNVEVAWESALHIWRVISEHELLRCFLYSIPHHEVERVVATVQTVRSVILIKSVLHTIEGELTICNTVTYASDCSTEEALTCKVNILVEFVVSKNDVCKFAITVGGEQLNNVSTKVCHGHLHAVCVLKSVEIYLLTIDFALEVLAVYLRKTILLLCLAGSEKPSHCKK